MSPVINAENLTKRFGTFRALDGFNLAVEEGSIHGFLGPNGSGKSTTIRILLGVLHPSAGSATVLGEDPRRYPEVLKMVGYVPGDVALWPALTGREVFRALESLRGTRVDPRREEELIDAFKLDPDKKTRDYSTGNRRKVGLIAALSFGAEVLILDEPTAGLDPLMEQVFIHEVRKERDRGATVLLSSHIMSEVEKLCDAVTVIKDGRTVESGTIEQLRHLSAHEITAVVTNPTSELQHLPDSHIEGNHFHVTVAKDDVSRILQLILDSGGVDITATPASLESLFLSHYGEAVS
ncbi:putative ABC transporter ATP-binding protein YbhF [Corynebacterium atrinae]|uniref:ABC transporter ATP-binding protein n=1 Tax=Corynebacterium atrinae TaxID=1336740 RepID=UPI0025B497F1|nr:ABC transporter ATP-binding protein [Corynebacterium atrinae]WJY64651.1 putative ABC transporter ATP-binding protein YbhF [Corynebacterium atrinae]